MPTYPIVGAFYRPPAQALIDVLPVGSPLTIFPEPENQFDPNAKAVWIFTENIPESTYDALEEKLPYSGFSLKRILSETAWHLGYIPKNIASQMESKEVEGKFSISPQGKPQISIQ